MHWAADVKPTHRENEMRLICSAELRGLMKKLLSASRSVHDLCRERQRQIYERLFICFCLGSPITPLPFLTRPQSISSTALRTETVKPLRQKWAFSDSVFVWKENEGANKARSPNDRRAEAGGDLWPKWAAFFCYHLQVEKSIVDSRSEATLSNRVMTPAATNWT